MSIARTLTIRHIFTALKRHILYQNIKHKNIKRKQIIFIIKAQKSNIIKHPPRYIYIHLLSTLATFFYLPTYIFYILLLHLSPVYPGLHPSSHFPVVMLHAALFKQCPAQLFIQSGPYLPGEHAKYVRTHVFNF